MARLRPALVSVEGNPPTDIRDASKMRTVIKNGEVFPLEELLSVPRHWRLATGDW